MAAIPRLGVALLVMGLIGCSGARQAVQPTDSPAPPPKPLLSQPQSPLPKAAADLYHVIRWGDTLSSIARWYTGNIQNWRVLQAANPGMDPERLRTGERLLIPADYLIRRETMPVNPPANTPTGSPTSPAPVADPDIPTDEPLADDDDPLPVTEGAAPAEEAIETAPPLVIPELFGPRGL